MTGSDPSPSLPPAQRILRVSRVVADLDRAAAFYCETLGFSVVTRRPVEAPILAALGVGDNSAAEVVLRLGAEEIALACFAVPGRPYPAGSRSDDLWFQHLAIVVSDMDAAYATLARHAGWRPISTGGPQPLPPSDGGVKAFKFRDPDGHPLELLWFPPGQGRAVWHRGAPGLFLGIDHTGLAVSAAPASVEFYAGLGFRVTARSLNQGPAQDRLDGLSPARATVTALRPRSDRGPGIELLGYAPPGRAVVNTANDLATDWITIEAAPGLGAPRAAHDPDGHRVLWVDQEVGGVTVPA